MIFYETIVLTQTQRMKLMEAIHSVLEVDTCLIIMFQTHP